MNCLETMQEITTTQYLEMGAMDFIGQTRVSPVTGIYYTCWRNPKSNLKYKIKNVIILATDQQEGQCMECGRIADPNCENH